MIIYLHMHTAHHDRAFTIVELLVVITILGILASIAIVSYIGINAKAKTSMVQSDLKNTSRQIDLYQVENSQYPDSTSELNNNKGLTLSPSDTLLSYAYDNAANYYCLTMKSGSIVTSIKNNTPPVNGYCMRNLIKNGDFSNGITNWNTENAYGTLSVVGGVAQHVSDGTSTTQYMRQNIATTIDVSHKVYSRINLKPVSYPAKAMIGTGCNYVIDIVYGNYYDCMSRSANGNPTYTQNTWSSFVVLSTQYGPQNSFGFDIQNTAHTIIDSGMIVQFDNVVMIDLTATFGAGNEPTQAAMDTMLATYPTKWFEGTVIVNK